eukprot:TRINITY_DN2331_c0_g1_i1.p1 TRINITY_DN2331_c0_g1~~TRINITY_DN2331_c0_g1_i1.p1  ORF type:complete len:147 (+),score=51.59 TRINITY_DN2331_c0_g1_i1:77-517(+)
MGNLQEKPRKDIVMVATAIEIVCVIQIIVCFGMMWATIFAGNNNVTTLYVFQWIMTFLPMIMPIIGIIGALRCLLSIIIVYVLWLILWVMWNVIYVVLLFALAYEPAHNEGVTTAFIGLNILLAWLALLLCFVFIGMNLGYRKNIE